MNTPSRRILFGLGLMLAFGIAAFVLPKHAVGNGKGLAAAGTAALTFLGFALLAIIASAYAFATALRHRESLNPGLRIVGLIPLPCLLIAIAIFSLKLIYKPGPGETPPVGNPTQPVASYSPLESSPK